MKLYAVLIIFFFFQAEDGIRDVAVTGVQTCALPISSIGATLFTSIRIVPSGYQEGELSERRTFAKLRCPPFTGRMTKTAWRVNSSSWTVQVAVGMVQPSLKV